MKEKSKMRERGEKIKRAKSYEETKRDRVGRERKLRE